MPSEFVCARTHKRLSCEMQMWLVCTASRCSIVWAHAAFGAAGMCDRGIPKGPDGSPGWDYSGRLAKAVFKKWDPAMGRPVSANPHDFGNWSTNYTILDLIGLDYPCTHGPCYDRCDTLLTMCTPVMWRAGGMHGDMHAPACAML